MRNRNGERGRGRKVEKGGRGRTGGRGREKRQDKGG
jgi:hypothetical protein